MPDCAAVEQDTPWRRAFPGKLTDMDFDETKVDEAVLALLWLTRFREKKDWPWRRWKGHDWDAMNRLHEAGLTEEGERRAEELFAKAPY
jgi:hypothetical protein